MTGQLTAQAAQAHTLDILRAAERHRQSHAEQLDRLRGRWLPLRPRRARTPVAPALITNEPCN